MIAKQHELTPLTQRLWLPILYVLMALAILAPHLASAAEKPEEGVPTPTAPAAKAAEVFVTGSRKVWSTMLPSGPAVFAKSKVRYPKSPNLNLAWGMKVSAFQQAEFNCYDLIGKALNGADQGFKREFIKKYNEGLDDNRTMGRGKLVGGENFDQEVKILLKGVTTHKIVDDGNTFELIMFLSADTLGKTFQLDSSITLADTFEDAQEELFLRLKKGVLAPVGGGKVVVVNSETGFEHHYWLGYGVDSVTVHEDDFLNTFSEERAEASAQLRADFSLMNNLRGAKYTSKIDLEGDEITAVRNYQKNQADNDPRIGTSKLITVDPFRRAEKTAGFKSVQRLAQNHRLPAGVDRYHGVSDDGRLKFSVSCLSLGSQVGAEKLRSTMEEPDVLERQAQQLKDTRAREALQKEFEGQNLSDTNTNPRLQKGGLKRLPSGIVTQPR